MLIKKIFVRCYGRFWYEMKNIQVKKKWIKSTIIIRLNSTNLQPCCFLMLVAYHDVCFCNKSLLVSFIWYLSSSFIIKSNQTITSEYTLIVSHNQSSCLENGKKKSRIWSRINYHFWMLTLILRRFSNYIIHYRSVYQVGSYQLLRFAHNIQVRDKYLTCHLVELCILCFYIIL